MLINITFVVSNLGAVHSDQTAQPEIIRSDVSVDLSFIFTADGPVDSLQWNFL